MFWDVPSFLRRHRFALTAVAVIAVGVVLRLALIAVGWPLTNSEEGTMGLEAIHILRGEHAVYLYGQSYMGVAEAYAGALAFRLFGISVFSLRLGMIAFDTIFLASACWLASLLYSRRVALVSVAALTLAWPFLMRCELLADGGKPETLASSALMFALASWLALTRPVSPPSRRQRRLRYGAFAAWGLVAGFALYTYLIVAPFVIASALLLWLTCRRELRGGALVCAGAGLCVGLLPTIIWVASLPLADHPVSLLQFLHQQTGGVKAGWHGWTTLEKQAVAPLLYSLPQATGLDMPYSLQDVPLFGPLGPATITAVIVGGTWSLVYLSLLAVATYRPLKVMNLTKRRSIATNSGGDARKWTIAESRAEARNTARLMLALAGWLTITAFVVNPVAAYDPKATRYLIGLATVVPVVLWPLVEVLQRVRSRRELLRAAWAPVTSLMLGLNVVNGVVSLIQDVPGIVAVNEQEARFYGDLLSHGITRFYSDYWTCDQVVFATHEHIICSTLSDSGSLSPHSRYAPYDAEVAADPRAPVLLVGGSSLETAFLANAAAAHQRYTVEHLDHYDVYVPMLFPN